MKRIKFLTFFSSLLLITFSVNTSYAVKPYNENPADFTARIEWSVEFVTNYIPPWHLPNEQKKPLTGIKYHYTLFYDASNKRKFATIFSIFEKGRDIADDFLYIRGMCSNNNIMWMGGVSVTREHINPFTGQIREIPEKDRMAHFGLGGTRKPDGTKVRGQLVYFKVPGGTMVIGESEGDMPPGGRLDFIIIAKGTKTMIGVWTLNGWRRAARWVFKDAGEAPPDYKAPMDAKAFKVVGPIVKPFPSDGPLAYIEKLIKITKEAYELGWIKKQDVYEGLNDKLVAAKDNIKKGWWNYHTARNLMEAYKHLLNAQRGKAIDEMTYRMLYYDANELIGMLK